MFLQEDLFLGFLFLLKLQVSFTKTKVVEINSLKEFIFVYEWSLRNLLFEDLLDLG